MHIMLIHVLCLRNYLLNNRLKAQTLNGITLKELEEIDFDNGWFKGSVRSQSFESTRQIVPSVNLSVEIGR